jgi:hypothetical protein
VVLTSFYPDSGRIAEKVILTGQNFGSDPDKIKVYFNKKRANVIGADGTEMYVVCPRLPGDTCDISVVIGNDSVVYAHQFKYKISVRVSTITGNGSSSHNFGTLAESTFMPDFVCVDKDDNIFVTLSSYGTAGFGMIRVNEEEDIVSPCALFPTKVVTPQPPGVNLETGVVSSAADDNREVYYTYDPKEAWATRYHSFTWKEGTQIPTNPWKKAISYSSLDGNLYVIYYNGHIVKINPDIDEAETIFRIAQGDCYGSAFHPLHPNLMYMVFATNAGENANGICVMDITQPETSFQRLSGTTAPGHRDGPLSQAQFNNPSQMQFDNDGNLYIADFGNHCIRKVTTEDIVETVVGIPGVAGWKDGGKEEALFNQPAGIGVKQDGTVYIAERAGCRVRKLAME